MALTHTGNCIDMHPEMTHEQWLWWFKGKSENAPELLVLRKQVPVMLEALEAVEWLGGKYGTACPECFRDQYSTEEGLHYPDCKLAAALKLARGESA